MADQKTTVARARMTDAEFSRLYAEHHAALVRFVNGMVRDTSLAQDVAQDAFLRAHSAVASFGDARAASAWLCQTARRIVIDEMRHRRVVPMSPLDDTVVEPLGKSAETQVVEGMVDASTSGAIARLPGQQRAALLLTAEGYGGAEMASRIGVSHGAARVLLHRARRSARDDIAHGAAGAETDPAQSAPFAPGDEVWHFRTLQGTLYGPHTVVKAPGRRPFSYECLVRRPDGETVEIDAATLWRDTPAVRAMAAAKARSYALTHKLYAKGRIVDLSSPEDAAEKAECFAARERANELVAAMSAGHPYGRKLYSNGHFVGRPGKTRTYPEAGEASL